MQLYFCGMIDSIRLILSRLDCVEPLALVCFGMKEIEERST